VLVQFPQGSPANVLNPGRDILKKIMIITVVVLLLLIAASLIVSYSFAYANIHAPRATAIDAPENYGYTNYENVSFPAGDDPNLIIRAWYIPPRPEKDGATIIYVHGVHAQRSWLLSQARFMIDEGYGALLIDLRNCGESDGDTSYLSEKEWHDVEGAVNYLKTRPEVNLDKLGIMGRSVGGAVVIRSQAELQRFKFVIAESTFSNMPELEKYAIPHFMKLPTFPFLPMTVFFIRRETGIDINKIDSVAQLQRFQNTPILFIHGSNDDWIPIAEAEELYAKAKEPKQLYVVEGAYHFPIVDYDPEGVKKVLLDFVHKYMP
jgi:uncharacterized protein